MVILDTYFRIPTGLKYLTIGYIIDKTTVLDGPDFVLSSWILTVRQPPVFVFDFIIVS